MRLFAPLIAALGLALAAPLAASAAEEGGHGGATPPVQSWSFSGPFGTYDPGQLQRGFRIYREVCSSCHGMRLLSFRNLADPGGPQFSEAQVRALAAEYEITDGPNDQGEMFQRPGRPSDRFPSPFANEQAARVANGGALPPDLSVIAKARTIDRGFPWFVFDGLTMNQELGPDYLSAILHGYEDTPAGVTPREGLYYNRYFPGHWIAMPKPLNDGQIDYTDGTPKTVMQYSNDVSAFLMWAAEPHLDARKRMGFQVMIFLAVFASLMYLTKKKVWKDVHAHA